MDASRKLNRLLSVLVLISLVIWICLQVLPINVVALGENEPDGIVSASYDVILQEDFQDNAADGWTFDPGWQLLTEGENTLLSGSGHAFAITPLRDNLTDFAVKYRFKLNNGGFHVNLRDSRGAVYQRYLLPIYPDHISLNKQLGSDFFSLSNVDLQLSTGQWHTFEAVLNGTNIKVYLDDVLKINYNDDERPLRNGGFSIETLDDTHAYFDDFTVEGSVIVQQYQWVKTGGPLGGLGYDVRISPANKSVMFLTDNPSGIQKSYDGGVSWSSINKGITVKTGPSGDGVPNFCLTIDPNDPDIVWAGMQGMRGLFKSIDGGETWVKKDNGITESDITLRGFAVRPNNSNVVFAAGEITTGVLGYEFDKTKGKIYRTDDGGESWRSVWEGDNLARVILFDPLNPDTMYASTGICDREAWNTVGVGVLKSTDGGNTWTTVNNGLDNLFIGFLEMHPRDPAILYAAVGVCLPGTTGGIYKTENGGGLWKKILDGSVFTVVVVSPSNPDVIYAGNAEAIYRSDNGGKTWQKYNKASEGWWGPPGVRTGIPISAVVDAEDPMTIFVNNYGGGIFKSTDGGKTWTDASKGYTGAHLLDVDGNPANPSEVFTIGRSGPFRSFDGGNSWEGLAGGDARYAEWYAVAINPQDSRQIIITDEHTGAILKSVNEGISWKLVFHHPSVNSGDPQNRHGFRALAYAPSDPGIIYAGMSKERRAIDGSLPAGPSFGMYKSTDGGDSWAEINNGLEGTTRNIMAIAIDPSNSAIVYIGTRSNGIYMTADGGRTWQPKNNGLMSMDIRSLAIDPCNASIVYAGLGEGAGIYKSTDGGLTWEAVNNGVIVECPSYLQRVGQVKLGVSLAKPKRIISQDYYSLAWSKINDIVVDPSDPLKVYAADESLGVYSSVDGGESWIPINGGLSTRAVSKLWISPAGDLIYAATIGEGIFRLQMGTPSPTTSPMLRPTYLPGTTPAPGPFPGLLASIAIIGLVAMYVHRKGKKW